MAITREDNILNMFMEIGSVDATDVREALSLLPAELA